MKTHLYSNRLKAEDFPNSYHIQHGIYFKLTTECGIIVNHSNQVSKHLTQVTCKGCKAKAQKS